MATIGMQPPVGRNEDLRATAVVPYLPWRAPCWGDHHRIPGLWR